MLRLILILTMLLSQSLQAEINKDGKFCYSRIEAEKILTCLEMKDVYEKKTLEVYREPDSGSDFVLYVALFFAGFATGSLIANQQGR